MSYALLLVAAGFGVGAALVGVFGSVVTLEGMRSNRGTPRFDVWARRSDAALLVFDLLITAAILALAAALLARISL